LTLKGARKEKDKDAQEVTSSEIQMVIRALKRSGFSVHHTTGSHYFLKKGKLRVSVPFHNKDLKPGTLASIIAQAGLTVEHFVELI
jgi:predicted RNA binding protein YcfA (HicA-like mRNA interferase family)